MKDLRSLTALACAFLIFEAVATAQGIDGDIRLSPDEIRRIAHTGASEGTSGVSGIETRILKGDPTRPGLYTIQLTVPARTRIKAHTHPDDRVGSVISGIWYIGYGGAFDESRLKALMPGSYYTEPPDSKHFAMTGDSPVVLQITGTGPTGTVYVEADNPAPSQKPNYESKFADVNGVKIHYLKSGSGKTPLVLIHGFGDDARMWVPLFEDFGNDYTLIAPDLRGLGDSSRPATGYDKKTAAVDVRELVRSLGYSKANVVGHDIGLMVAYAYAAQFPNEVLKLALLEAPIPGIGPTWNQIYTNPVLWHFHFVKSPIALDLVRGRERTFLEHFWQSLSAHPEKFGESDRRMYASSYAREGVMRNAFEYFKAFNDQDAADNRQFATTKLPMPLLVIAGDKAMGPALEGQAKLISDNVKAIVFNDTGHWLMEERPAETAAALKSFFSATNER